MSRKTVVICDKCKKEVTTGIIYPINISKLSSKDMDMTYDLCSSCKARLELWFDEKL